MAESLRDFAVRYAERFIGRPYRWGGDDPSGFDCSGLCVEVLQACGLFDRKSDATADTLWRTFARLQTTDVVRPGCLVLFGTPERATHVEIVCRVDQRNAPVPGGVRQTVITTIGASGGGSKTLTDADAWAQNAYVKVRPIRIAGARQDVLGFVDPFVGVEACPA
jgi:cell wall-associated NlpC family hydrolase